MYFDKYYRYIIRGKECRWHSAYKSAQIFRAYHPDGKPRMLYYAVVDSAVAQDGVRLCILEDVNLSGIKTAIGQYRNGVAVTGTDATVWEDQLLGDRFRMVE